MMIDDNANANASDDDDDNDVIHNFSRLAAFLCWSCLTIYG